MNPALVSSLLLLSATVLAVFVARRAGLPSILAYLAVGALLGPYGIKWLGESQEVSLLAEFGVVFLMFSIGLEFSVTRLRAMKVLVFGLGGSQMALTSAGTAIVAMIFYEQTWKTAVAVGLAVAMSSTAIVAKMLSERFELHSRSGRQTMGVLLFQDLAVVPCLILLPALASSEHDLLKTLLTAALTALLVLILLGWMGQRVLRRIFDLVARERSDELFVLATLWVVMGLASLTQFSGLSLALGAFVGGMLISETIYRHQVEADIRPFRDILLGLFFVTIGMMLDLGFVIEHWQEALIALGFLVTGKALVVLVIGGLARQSLHVSLRTAAQLAQGGEFGLVLIELAQELKLIGKDTFQITTTAMLGSMFLAPFLIRQTARLGSHLAATGGWRKTGREAALAKVARLGEGLADHVIVCGFGRTGQQVGEFLATETIPYLALDNDPQLLKALQKKGIRIGFGSADRVEILRAAGLMSARAVVVTYPDLHSAEKAVHIVHRLRPDVPIVVRAADDGSVRRLKQAGATEVIPEVLEGGLMIAAETLAQLGVPIEKAISRVRQIRAERYSTLRMFYGSARDKTS